MKSYDFKSNQYKPKIPNVSISIRLKIRNYSDVEDVKFVINFDYPNNSEDYVHRIGRTGRSNNTGTAYTLFTYQNASKANDLINVLKEANQVSFNAPISV